jgi:DNA-binding NarL/FixJ family response regulator
LAIDGGTAAVCASDRGDKRPEALDEVRSGLDVSGLSGKYELKLCVLHGILPPGRHHVGTVRIVALTDLSVMGSDGHLSLSRHAHATSESFGLGVRMRLHFNRAPVRMNTTTGSTARLPMTEGKDTPHDPVRVLLVETHVALREAIALGFEREPGFTVAGEAGTLAEARELLDGIDVAVVDLRLPDGYGGDLVKELLAVNPQAHALALGMGLDHAEIARAMDSGAAGVLDGTAHLDEIVDAVRRLRAGETLMPLTDVIELLRFAGRQREREREDRKALARLTPREREVLQALAEGLDSQGIADRLHITVRTERNHIASILAKLGVHSQLQALVFALRYGIVEIR